MNCWQQLIKPKTNTDLENSYDIFKYMRLYKIQCYIIEGNLSKIK